LEELQKSKETTPKSQFAEPTDTEEQLAPAIEDSNQHKESSISTSTSIASQLGFDLDMSSLPSSFSSECPEENSSSEPTQPLNISEFSFNPSELDALSNKLDLISENEPASDAFERLSSQLSLGKPQENQANSSSSDVVEEEELNINDFKIMRTSNSSLEEEEEDQRRFRSSSLGNFGLKRPEKRSVLAGKGSGGRSQRKFVSFSLDIPSPSKKEDILSKPEGTTIDDSSASEHPSFLDVFHSSPSISTARIQNESNWSTGMPVVLDYASKEDTNKKGMRRAKKGKTVHGSQTILEMEDRHVCCFPLAGDASKALFCVFDGHAGKNCADDAVKLFPLEFERQLSEHSPMVNPPDLVTIFKDTYQKIDQALLKYDYEGCTGTTVFVWQFQENRYLQSANVGDSTAFIQLFDHSIVPLSKDHKPTDAEERERIIASGSELTPTQTRVGGLAVSRALGDHFLKQEKLGVISEPFVSPVVSLGSSRKNILIVASDGLWDVLSAEQAFLICSSCSDANSMASALIRKALEDSRCTDNITVIIAML